MIRPAVLADLPAVAAAERAAAGLFAGTHMAWAVEGPTLPRWRLRAGVARGLLLVADTGRVAGFIIAAPAYGTLFIEEFSVAPAYQRQGLGRALLAALEARARARGVAALTLTTDRTLPWNAPFYARCGFAEVAGPDWLMARLRRQRGHEFRCAMRKPLPPLAEPSRPRKLPA
jgi:GNAT superfamily N-acetyltransferase